MDVNPYQPPTTDPFSSQMHGDALLATRGSRFGAALIDSIAVGVVNGVLMWQLGFLDALTRGRADFGTLAMLAGLGFGTWLAIQIAFLAKGQTLGKRLLGICMVDYETGEVPPLGRLIFLRYLPTSLVTLIPGIGNLLPLIDVLFIFGDEQRCIHDRIAGTKVVQLLQTV